MNWLTTKQRYEIRDHAVDRIEEETCGFVLTDGTVVAVANEAEDKANRFMIGPVAYAKYDEAIAGVWHSHLELAGFSELDQQVLSADVLPWAVYCLMDDSFHECDPNTVAPFEGRPFVFGVYDCYSLISDFLKSEGVDLPPWTRGTWGEWNTPGFTPFDDESKNYGKPVGNERYQAGDILLLNLGDYANHTDHVGVFVNNKQFLHHPSQGVSRLQTFGSYWKRRLNLVIRPHSLCSH